MKHFYIVSSIIATRPQLLIHTTHFTENYDIYITHLYTTSLDGVILYESRKNI